jgi:Protein of unknown function (DUF2587)
VPDQEVSQDDRPLDPEKLLRLAGLVKGVLEELRQMDLRETGEQTAEELAALYQRVSSQVAEGLPNTLRSELEATDLGLPFKDGATGQEVRLAYAGLIGWLSGLFQGLQAAMQYQQMQNLALQQAGDRFSLQPDRPSQDTAGRTPEHATGQYL